MAGRPTILFVNHTAVKSGAEATTLELLRRLPPAIAPVLACPRGELAEEARAAGVPVRSIGGLAGSFRLDCVETPAAIGQTVRMGLDVRSLAHRTGADLIHATSIRAGLATCVPLGPRPPVLVSLHDCLPPGRMAGATRWLIDSRAALLVANSDYTAAAWRPLDRGAAPLHVVHPGVDLKRHRSTANRYATRAALGLHPRGPVLGVAAQITPWKGQATAIRALHRVRERVPTAQLALVGEPKFVRRATRLDNRAFLAHLHDLVDRLRLDGAVRFVGPRQDMPDVMAALDVLLVPSTEEPFGLVIVEAMAAGTPVISTSRGGPAEIIRDGVNGRLAPPDDVDRWADATADLLADDTARKRFATMGRRTAERFSADRYAAEILGAYRTALRS